MSSLPIIQPTALAFVAGIALGCAAAIVWWKRPLESSQNRLFLAVFAFGQALSEWCGIGTAAMGGAIFSGAQILLSAVAFMALLELAKRTLNVNGRPLIKSWIYLLILGICGFKYWWSGWEGLDLASRFAIALPAGVFATVAIARGAKENRRSQNEITLIAAAIGFLTVGHVFGVTSLRAFAGLGFLVGIWRLTLNSLSGDVPATWRWRAPLAFVLVTATGAITVGLMVRPRDASQEALTTVVYAADGEGGTTSSGKLLGHFPIDTRQLARDRASEQRYKQGIMILVVLGVVAVVWAGLAHLPRSK
jgi:hypothetical protein